MGVRVGDARYRRCGDGLIVATSRDQKPGLRKFRYLGTRSTHNAPFAAELAPFVGLFFPNRSQNPRNVRERGLTGGGAVRKGLGQPCRATPKVHRQSLARSGCRSTQGGGFEINYRRRYSNGTSQQGSPCAAPEWLLGGRFSADADPLGLSESRLAPRVTQIVCIFLR